MANASINTANTTCHLIYQSITSPTTYIYASLFIVSGIIAAVGNTLALIILWQPQMRTKANKILRSLVVSDAMVGYFLFPYATYMMFTPSTLKSCTAKYTIAFFGYSLIGVSIISVSIVAYDRYILMTKLNNYNLYQTDRKINIMLIASWVLSIMVTALDFFSKRINSYALYTFTRFAMGGVIISVLIALVVFYVLLVRCIKLRAREMNSHRSSIAGGDDRSSAANHHHVKLAKKVTLLIICYIACLLPTVVSLVVRNIYKSRAVYPVAAQQFSLFSLFTAALNSCLNPIIYAAKYPEFNQRLKVLVGWRATRKPKSNSVLSLTSVEHH